MIPNGISHCIVPLHNKDESHLNYSQVVKYKPVIPNGTNNYVVPVTCQTGSNTKIVQTFSAIRGYNASIGERVALLYNVIIILKSKNDQLSSTHYQHCHPEKVDKFNSLTIKLVQKQGESEEYKEKFKNAEAQLKEINKLKEDSKKISDSVKCSKKIIESRSNVFAFRDQLSSMLKECNTLKEEKKSDQKIIQSLRNELAAKEADCTQFRLVNEELVYKIGALPALQQKYDDFKDIVQTINKLLTA